MADGMKLLSISALVVGMCNLRNCKSVGNTQGYYFSTGRVREDLFAFPLQLEWVAWNARNNATLT